MAHLEGDEDDWRAAADDRSSRTAAFLRAVDARAADAAIGKLADEADGEGGGDRADGGAPPRTRASRFAGVGGGAASRAPAPAPAPAPILEDDDDDGEGWDEDGVGELLARRRAIVEAATLSEAATRIQAAMRGRSARKVYTEALEEQFEREQAEMDAAARRQVEEGLVLVEG
jgi:hypothetical protein